IIAFLVVWNGLLLLDWSTPPHAPGVLTLLAVALAFAIALALTRSSEIEALAMKPGRSVSEILPVVRLAQLITGAMVLVFAIDDRVPGGVERLAAARLEYASARSGGSHAAGRCLGVRDRVGADPLLRDRGPGDEAGAVGLGDSSRRPPRAADNWRNGVGVCDR